MRSNKTISSNIEQQQEIAAAFIMLLKSKQHWVDTTAHTNVEMAYLMNSCLWWVIKVQNDGNIQ